MPYYYANDTYYLWSDADHQYQVVAPPSGIDQANPESAAAPSSELFVYPRNGQTPEQTENDRYECHGWAVSQSGFDPTRPEQTGDAEGYRRAMVACLDSRGYSSR